MEAHLTPARQASCMFTNTMKSSSIVRAGGREAQRSGASRPPAGDARSIVSGQSHAVTERDRRRLCGTIPNSRLSGRRHPAAVAGPSSHAQDRDASMNDSPTFVGIDVSKDKLDGFIDTLDQSFSAPDRKIT